MLERLTTLVARGTAPDLMICNYVYEHVEDGTSHTAVSYTHLDVYKRQGILLILSCQRRLLLPFLLKL